MIDIRIVITPIKADFADDVPAELQEKRLAIFSTDLVTRISSLQDYTALVYSHLTEDERSGNSTFSKNVPWQITSQKSLTAKWTIKDELIAASVVLALLYQDLASSLISAMIVKDTASLRDDNWKIANGWLKQCLTLVRFLIQSQLYNNEIDFLSLGFLHFLSHLTESSTQLTLLMKINYLKIENIIKNDWNFNVDTDNHHIYLKVCIFIGDELSICEQTLQDIPSCKDSIDIIRAYKLYIKIYIAYYSALEFYSKNQIGFSLGVLNYIKGSLLKNDDKSEEEPSEVSESKLFKKKLMTKITKRSGQTDTEKDVIKQITSKKDFKLNKKFSKKISQTCISDLINLIKLINLINLKFLKENDNIHFQKTCSIDEAAGKINQNLPLGRKIPTSVEEVPSFLSTSKSTSQKKYAGSGSYY